MVAVGSLLENVSAAQCVTQRNEDALEGEAETGSRKRARGPWICTKRKNFQAVEVG